jgi:mannose-6-phosphate isomerase-like protein (cupin superfamily)
VIRIFDLNAAPAVPMEQGRGETVRLVDASIGTEKLDVHVNRLVPGGPRGRVHRHTHSDNIYIVRRGEGMLTADGRSYTLRPDQVVFIPAGVVHSLSNLSNDVFEIVEIWAPAGRQFDSVPVE